MTYTIRLSDGTTLTGLTLNGNNFVSENEVTRETFAGKLNGVTITCDEENYSDEFTGEHAHMKLIQIAQYEWDAGKWYFILSDMSEAELKELRLESRLDYLEMLEGM